MCKFFGEPLKQVILLRGQIVVSRTGDDPACLPCNVQNVPRVYRHHAHMCFNMCAWCRYTRRRFEHTHRDVLSGDTGFFSAPHHTTHTPRPQRHTQHNTTSHGDRGRRQRRREEREDGRGETRQDKRRQDKTKEKTRKRQDKTRRKRK